MPVNVSSHIVMDSSKDKPEMSEQKSSDGIAQAKNRRFLPSCQALWLGLERQ